jgi:hypothetical protein
VIDAKPDRKTRSVKSAAGTAVGSELGSTGSALGFIGLSVAASAVAEASALTAGVLVI